jgi:hypothetical protein
MFACKIRLNEEGDGDYAIRFPIGLCEPLNAKNANNQQVSIGVLKSRYMLETLVRFMIGG